MKKINYWLAVVFWAGVIFTLSSFQVESATEIYWQDFVIKKTAHLLEYGTLFILLYRAFLNTTNFSKMAAALLSLVLVLIYGLTDEYHQSFTPGREAKARDVVIDGAGGALAWLGLWKYLPKAPEKLQRWAKGVGL